jgi:hypothetical protein
MAVLSLFWGSFNLPLAAVEINFVFILEGVFVSGFNIELQ